MWTGTTTAVGGVIDDKYVSWHDLREYILTQVPFLEGWDGLLACTTRWLSARGSFMTFNESLHAMDTDLASTIGSGGTGNIAYVVTSAGGKLWSVWTCVEEPDFWCLADSHTYHGPKKDMSAHCIVATAATAARFESMLKDMHGSNVEHAVLVLTRENTGAATPLLHPEAVAGGDETDDADGNP